MVFVVSPKYRTAYEESAEAIRQALNEYGSHGASWEDVEHVMPSSEGRTFIVSYAATRRSERTEVAKCTSFAQALFVMANAVKGGLYEIREVQGDVAGECMASRRIR